MDERMACSPNEDILRQQSNEMVWISAAIFARVPVFMASSYSVIPWISLYLKTNIPSVPVVFKCSLENWGPAYSSGAAADGEGGQGLGKDKKLSMTQRPPSYNFAEHSSKPFWGLFRFLVLNL